MSPRRLLAVPLLLMLIILVCAVVLYTSRRFVLTKAAQWFDVGQPATHTDYLYVLNGEPNTRPLVAAALINRGYAASALVAKVKTPASRANSPWPPPHKKIVHVMRRRGVPDEKIRLITPEVSNTRDEAEALALALADEPDATVTVITNGFHTRRARFIFRLISGEAADRISFFSAPSDGFSDDDWWTVEEGVITYSNEACKLFFYHLRYGTLGFGLAAALLTVLSALAWRLWKTRRYASVEGAD